MTLHIPIPNDLDEASVRELEKEAREAVAVRLYRQGNLSHGKFAEFLAIGRGEVDDVLARHGVVDEFTAEEIAEQTRTSRNLRNQG
jgi:predicted HTH domain antitoxin